MQSACWQFSRKMIHLPLCAHLGQKKSLLSVPETGHSNLHWQFANWGLPNDWVWDIPAVQESGIERQISKKPVTSGPSNSSRVTSEPRPLGDQRRSGAQALAVDFRAGGSQLVKALEASIPLRRSASQFRRLLHYCGDNRTDDRLVRRRS